jgi:uncharacterized membrane protein YfcA
MLEAAVALIGVVAGAVAAVAGFGIGSLLTPLVAVETGIKVAVAIVSIPHFAGTALRLWLLRRHADRRVLVSFGSTSAAGGLAGALLHAEANRPSLALVFALLLCFAGLSGLTGLAQRMRFSGAAAWIAGAVSGVFGGLVGNQGGIRSAAMLGLDVPKEAFVATATAIALAVDVARMPVYVYVEGPNLVERWPLVAFATAGVVAGTLGGARVLARIPERLFRKMVSALILLLGVAMLVRGG